MSDKQLELTIFAYLKKAKRAGLAEIIANCLKGSTYTFPEMREALGNLRESGKLNWSKSQNKYLLVEKKHVATGKRKATKSKPAK